MLYYNKRGVAGESGHCSYFTCLQCQIAGYDVSYSPVLSPQYSVEGVANEEDVLDYGVLSESDITSKIFTVHNVNPVEVSPHKPVCPNCLSCLLISHGWALIRMTVCIKWSSVPLAPDHQFHCEPRATSHHCGASLSSLHQPVLCRSYGPTPSKAPLLHRRRAQCLFSRDSHQTHG